MISPFPSPHLVQVRRYSTTTTDTMGNPVPVYGDPSDWWVRSIDPVSNREPGSEHRDLSIIALTIHADKSADVPGYRDLVVIGTKEYPVDGEPDDWTRGPWDNPAAGVVVWLRRAEG